MYYWTALPCNNNHQTINTQSTGCVMLPGRQWVSCLFLSSTLLWLTSAQSAHVMLYVLRSTSCLWCDQKLLVILQKKSNFAEFEKRYEVIRSCFIFIDVILSPSRPIIHKQLQSICKKKGHMSRETTNLYIPGRFMQNFQICMLSGTFSPVNPGQTDETEMMCNWHLKHEASIITCCIKYHKISGY